MKPSCASCNDLRKCSLVTAPRIENGYRCRDWSLANKIEIGAREQLIEEFGLWALRYDVPKLERKTRPKARRRKRDG